MLAALRLPLTLVLGFLLVLVADALILRIAADIIDGVLTVDNFGSALLAALVVAAVSVVLAVILGSDDTYGLDELVQRSLAKGDVSGIAGGDEQSSMVGNAFSEATGKKAKKAKNDVSDRDVVVLGSGNLGLVYLMEERRRLTLEELDARHPELVPALRAHPHVGWLLVRSSEHGPVALGARYLVEGRVEGEDPLAPFSPNAPRHLLRTDGFTQVADITVGSFYDPELDEGCAFEELFPRRDRRRPDASFILHPAQLELPPGPIIGAASVHAILPAGDRRSRPGCRIRPSRRRLTQWPNRRSGNAADLDCVRALSTPWRATIPAG